MLENIFNSLRIGAMKKIGVNFRKVRAPTKEQKWYGDFLRLETAGRIGRLDRQAGLAGWIGRLDWQAGSAGWIGRLDR